MNRDIKPKHRRSLVAILKDKETAEVFLQVYNVGVIPVGEMKVETPGKISDDDMRRFYEANKDNHYFDCKEVEMVQEFLEKEKNGYYKDIVDSLNY